MGDKWLTRVVVLTLCVVPVAWFVTVIATIVWPDYKIPDSVSGVMSVLMVALGGALTKWLLKDVEK